MTILSALALVAYFGTANRTGAVNFVFGELMEMLVIVPSKIIVRINLAGNTSLTNCMAPSHLTKISGTSFHFITLQF